MNCNLVVGVEVCNEDELHIKFSNGKRKVYLKQYEESWAPIAAMCDNGVPATVQGAAEVLSAMLTGKTVRILESGEVDIIELVTESEPVPEDFYEDLIKSYVKKRRLPPLDDQTNADVLASLIRSKLRLTGESDWRRFDGMRWVSGGKRNAIAAATPSLSNFWLDTARAFDLFTAAHEEAEKKRVDAAILAGDKKARKRPSLASQARNFAMECRSGYKIREAIELLRGQPDLWTDASEFDSDPWALNVQNGILNLKTGHLKPHSAESLHSKLAPINYDPIAGCPVWESTIERICCGDKDLKDYLWRALGYSITGDKSRHVVFCCHGTGANGKSTFFGLMQYILGDYAQVISESALLASAQGHDRHLSEIAGLRGARMVYQPEIKAGRVLDEGRIKQLSGGDMVSANLMRQDQQTFRPDMKLWIAFNQPPRISGADHGIWRRLKYMPWNARFDTNVDYNIMDKLKSEASGILIWLVNGCMEFQAKGLTEPAVIHSQSASQREEEIPLLAFIQENIRDDEDGSIPVAEFRERFLLWLGDNGLKDGDGPGQKQVAGQLRELEWKPAKVVKCNRKSVRCFVGKSWV